MKSGVYQIKNLLNNKIYIGSTIDFEERWERHNKDLNKNLHHSQYLQRSWNKNKGLNFIFETIENIEKPVEITKEEFRVKYLLPREQYYIDILNPEYNVCKIAGSCLGIKHSEEYSRKMSEAKKGEKHPMYGKHHSEETKQKMREKRTLQIFSEETKRKMSKNRKRKRCKEEHPFYGKHHTEESKKKMGESKKGRIPWNKGIKMLEETKRKMNGEKHSSSKLKWDEVREIRKEYNIENCSYSKLAEEYGVSRRTIEKIIKSLSWKE